MQVGDGVEERQGLGRLSQGPWLDEGTFYLSH